ncbi:hypothetical protein GF325_05635 [Candidatus Bathyarchaeota archaeon]|nr:hypothetical protein [Candidatus Bathyarchaeota archaeon]
MATEPEKNAVTADRGKDTITKSEKTPEEFEKRDSIMFEGKKYQFNPYQVLFFAIATPIWVIVLYALLEYALWLRVIVADHTISSLNFITGMGASLYFQDGIEIFTTYSELLDNVGAITIFFSHVSEIDIFFDIPGKGDIQFITFCTGFQAIIIFSGLIIFTPHPMDQDARKGIWKRKIKSLWWSSFIFYVVNLIRMWIQLYLYYLGFEWENIHYSISAASSFIAVLIVVLMHRILPEFVLCIVWTGVQVKDRYFPKVGYKKP